MPSNSTSEARATEPRWYGQSDWFSLPRALRYDDRLTHTDIHALIAIASFEMKGGKIRPPRWQLKIFTGISESNFSKRTQKLEELGWLKVIATRGRVNHYILLIPDYAKERQVTVSEEIRLEAARRAEKKRKKQAEWRADKSSSGTEDAQVDDRQLSIDYDFEPEDF
jgi:hypothetical protein